MGQWRGYQWSFAGLYVLTSVQDNGISANEPPDQVGLSIFDPEPFDCTTRPDVD